MKNYNFKEIERKWQNYWEENKTYKVFEDPKFAKDKRFYILDMFSYPSGDGLHVGHPLGYTATDIVARFKMLNGFNVLHPMGFDSFGLPAETYAIKTGQHPKVTTEKNIKKFKRQIKSLGFAYDWDREIRTHDEDYYKWTQWIFLKLYKRGLAYIKEMPVWFCPELGTVLANEEVVNTPQGPRSERGLHKVERRPLRQWILKITEYAEELLEGLDELDWSDSIKQMQRNWIGKSIGAEVFFKVENTSDLIKVFTTRVDTLFGVSYIVLAPENELVEKIVREDVKNKVKEYIEKTKVKTDLERSELEKEKTGIFIGAYALNPITGEKLEIWISDYVLNSYGSGAVMAVPAHDKRDFVFAKKYNLNLKEVVSKDGLSKELKEPFTEEGITINSGSFSNLDTLKAREEILNWLIANKKGRKKINYKMRDWIFSRQRYWGEPIPILVDSNGNTIPLEEDELPLTLPEIQEYKPAKTGASPLENLTDWVNIERDGKKYKRETNTMPQWAGSCWYYLRYLDPKNEREFVAKDKIDYWMPVDLYVGGAEHAVLHLLYARFWHKVLFDLKLVNTSEPFKKLVNQGMITSYAYQDKNGALIPSDKVIEVNGKFKHIESGEELKQIIAKMSKSLKNVINPDKIIEEYGADTLRIYEMFMGPLEDSKPWNMKGLIGVHRFVNKIWSISEKKFSQNETPKDLISLMQKTIKKVTQDIELLHFNTAVSQMMIFINELYSSEENFKELWKNFIIILSPFAPHMSEELWNKIEEESSLFKNAKWPSWNENLILEEKREIVVQINGKIRAKFLAEKELKKEELEDIALKNSKIRELTTNKKIIKIIIVENKLVNIVIK